jgi:hypothetical protein
MSSGYPSFASKEGKSSEFRKIASYAGGEIRKLAQEVDRGQVTVKTLKQAKAQLCKLLELMDSISPS